MDHKLKVALAQIAPVWLDKYQTLKKVNPNDGESSGLLF